MPIVAQCEGCGGFFEHKPSKRRRNCSVECRDGKARRERPPVAMGNGIVGLPLQDGSVALVDADAPAIVFARPWCSDKHGYAVSRIDGTVEKLHRVILQSAPDEDVDHRDGNKLDCRRSNLRRCTNDQNAKNRPTRRSFKGVYKTRSGRWVAKIDADRQTTCLGTFDSEEAGARAYDAAARQLHGEFARVNFPREGEQPARVG